tara:strand:+ start:137 stop:316 length:180 start_codon:yes stop_codon:yes gene_type:complete
MSASVRAKLEEKLEYAARRLRILENDDTIHVSDSPYWTDLRETRNEYYELRALLKRDET